MHVVAGLGAWLTASVNGRRSTIDDVAKAAGVARVTVSRVLNNERGVRPETRERVRDAVAALRFSVNLQARALASGVDRTILLIHAHGREGEPNSHYHSGHELGPMRACSAIGYELVTRSINPMREDRGHLIAAIVQRLRPAGIVLPPPFSDDLDLLTTMKGTGIRVSTVSAGKRGRGVVSSAGIDERAGGAALGGYLASLGHRDIAFIKGPNDHLAASLRYEGFVEALKAAGLGREPWTASGDFNFKSGVEAAESLLAQGKSFTALACANDDMAAGAMFALHRARKTIPGDISVTGFDDSPMSEIVWPPLTTVRQPIKDIAERAVRMLLDPPHEGEYAPFEALPHELVIRESTAAPGRTDD
ncbi:LacI family DNA-binding transcriptional regulator [Sphingomonas daechungensis]|uniref:LacI family DNA-binding transcriptional regulator n=1 Tax=Sphingomonas daechungensis TaxID=1176646 RepID=UPI003783F5B7